MTMVATFPLAQTDHTRHAAPPSSRTRTTQDRAIHQTLSRISFGIVASCLAFHQRVALFYFGFLIGYGTGIILVGLTGGLA